MKSDTFHNLKHGESVSDLKGMKIAGKNLQSRQSSSNQSDCHGDGDESHEGREGCRPPEGDEGHEEVKSLIFVGKKA